MRWKLLILFTFITLLFSPAVYAQNEALNMSLLVAFIGGILMFISPCSFSLLPAYFAHAFQERRKLVIATSVFFLGFAFMFSLFGFTAGFIGYYLNLYRPEITFYLGFLFIALGFLMLTGKGFPHIRIGKFGKSMAGSFLFGAAYSFGYAGCAGPILAGVLLVATTLPALNASLLMFVYSLGLGIPLILISYFFDRVRIFDRRIFTKQVVNFKNRIIVTIPSIVSAALLFLIGYIYIRYRSIYPLNTGFPSLRDLSYSIQSILLKTDISVANLVFIISIVAVMVIVFKLGWTNKISKTKPKRR